MLDAITFFIRWLKERETNRQLVLSNCVDPLLSELEKLHKLYVERLNAYKAHFQSGQESFEIDLKPALDLDQDLAITIRAQIVSRASSLQSVAEKRLDTLDESMKRFMLSVAEYLEGPSPDRTVIAEAHNQFPGLISFRNPTLDRAHVFIASTHQRSDVVELLDRLLVGQHQRYVSVQKNASVLRSELLA